MTVPESFQDRSFRFSLEILKFYRLIKQKTDLPYHIANQRAARQSLCVKPAKRATGFG